MCLDEDQIKMIEGGMADIANKSCIKFVPRASDKEHAVIIQVSHLAIQRLYIRNTFLFVKYF